jgi:hypothetical protein
MNITKLLTLSLATSALLLLTACGGGSGGTTTPADTTDDTTSNIVPKTINISIPDGLKSSRGTTSTPKKSFQKTSDTIESRGYTQLKSTINEVESTIKNVKENMVLLSSMMPDIQTECVGTAINELCTIPAGVISLTIDSTIISDLDEIGSEFDTVEDEGSLPPLNTKLTMGQVLYTQFDSTHTYQQDVVIDLKPTFTALGLTVTKQLETVRWSDDNNSVETISNVDDSDGTFNMHLIYSKNSDGTATMNIADSFSDSTISGNFAVIIKELNDTNKTIEINSDGSFSATFEGTTFNDVFNSFGKISQNGGFLNSTGTFGADSKYAEKETFDKNGNILQSKFCSEFIGETCDINNESTWHTFDDELGLDDNSFDDEGFNDNAEKTLILDITEGNLEIGRYTLLAQNFDFTTVDTAEKIGEQEIAFLRVFLDNSNKKVTSGIINRDNYSNGLDLNQLNLYKIDYPEFHGAAVYTKITGDVRPTFTVTEI